MPERRARNGATASGARAGASAPAAVTLLNLRCADGRGRFSGTKLSSELARHAGHRLRSLHRGGPARASTVTTAPPPSAVEAITASRARAIPAPPSAIPTTAHAAATTHARRSDDPPDLHAEIA